MLDTQKCSVKIWPLQKNCQLGEFFFLKSCLEVGEKQRSREGEAICGNRGKFLGQSRIYTGLWKMRKTSQKGKKKKEKKSPCSLPEMAIGRTVQADDTFFQTSFLSDPMAWFPISFKPVLPGKCKHQIRALVHLQSSPNSIWSHFRLLHSTTQERSPAG